MKKRKLPYNVIGNKVFGKGCICPSCKKSLLRMRGMKGKGRVKETKDGLEFTMTCAACGHVWVTVVKE